MTTTTTITTATPCPDWCVVDHTGDEPGGFHAGPSIENDAAPARLWQQDAEGARPGVVVAGHLLSDDQAHELGLALLRAADVLRRARMDATR